MLIAHILCWLVGVAMLGVSFVFACLQLVKHQQLKRKVPIRFLNFLPPVEKLDRIAHRCLVLGYPFMTLGFFLGIYLAHAQNQHAWISDPIVIWTLLFWLWYAVMLGARFIFGFRGRKYSWCSIAGFALVLVTFAGLRYCTQPGVHQLFQ